jgi:uncharacterized membrane protein
MPTAAYPPWQTEPVRGFLIGLVLIPLLVVSVLTLRPGGLRYQLAQVRRRFKLALVLLGIYLGVSTAVRLAWPGREAAEVGLGVLGLVLALVFLVLGQDREPAAPLR